MKQMKKIGAVLLVLTLAVSVMSLGFASWKTDITASGAVSASGVWDVDIFDASVTVSTGAGVAVDSVLTRTGVASNSSVAASLCSGNWADDESLIGSRTEEALSSTLNYFAVDTTKYDVSDVTKLDRSTVAADESTVVISDVLTKYVAYAHIDGINEETEEETAARQQRWKTAVMDGFLSDMAALLQEKFPETYRNYALIRMVGVAIPNFGAYDVIATFEDGDTAVIADDAKSVTYQDVSFALPGAWAQYSLTVVNHGTVDANLADAVIELTTESDQLTLLKPDLSEEILSPGESCTITFVLQVPETVEGDLDAEGTLTVKLPYSQSAVEEAPAAGHTHG